MVKVAGNKGGSAPAEGERSPKSSSPKTERLLASFLSTTILGELLPMDYYARVGFRFLSLPAWADSAALTTRMQQFRSLYKVDQSRARAKVLATIRDAQLDAEMVLEAVSKLESPRHRFIAELFWPHIAEAEFDGIRQAGSLASNLSFPLPSGEKPGSLCTAQVLHAMALSCHCRVIEEELKFLDSGGIPPDGTWGDAISRWRKVCEYDAFWHYLTRRVEKLDDPRLRQEDVRSARAEIPRIILGLNELFAEGYSASGQFHECTRHLKLIRYSGFSKEVIESASASAVRRIVGKRLEKLLRQAQQGIESMQAKTSRGAFKKVVEPFLAEAREIQEFLVRQLEIPEELLSHSAFDPLAETLLRGLDNKLSYEGEERERNFVYASVFCRWIMVFPLSGEVRRRVEQSIRDNGRYLYSRYGLEATKCPDPSQCFFLEGAEADPDASKVVPLYRITGRKVEVNRYSSSWGVRVSYESSRLIIPCSRAAASAKRGKVELDVPEQQYTPAQTAAAQQLKQMEAAHKQELVRIERERDAAVHAEENRTSRELEEVRSASSDKVGAARRAVEQEKAEEQRQLGAEQERKNQELDRLKKELEPRTREATAKAKRLKDLFAGRKGFLKIELPAFALVGAAFLISGWPEAMPAQVLLSVGSAWLAGRFLRRQLDQAAQRVSRGAEKAYAAAQRKCEMESKRRTAEINRISTQRCAPHDAGLADAQKGEEKIRKEGQGRRERTLSSWNEKIQHFKDEFAKDSQKLRAQLRRVVDIKDIDSRKKEFPPLKAAMGSGLKEGKEPSSWEMEPTASERTEAEIQILLGR